ncbi:hypothetical protein DWW36_19370 [Erysipelotrichaceae bacterium AF15-26LB]|nr:hypothetical protein HMPREF0983_01912 [Erysipelotrichaceae bacterium 3_1_53]MCR0349413.1 SdpI family protein [[Clostridium] innocuum]RJV82685.1 hypothetical protein DWX45_21395 [Erysipelotrichaceae bacterium AF19-24AC]RJV82799.1 hypothetical protein DWW36_19370 [Erysipelotrichaceae bacterium AF15-26LB]
MAFWLFMLIMNLLVPATMIVFGYIFQKHPPKDINGIYGYRTALSMKNEDTWKTAHLVCGKVWFSWGFINTGIALIGMSFLYGKDDTACGIYGGLLCMVECAILLLALLPVERTMHKMFHKDGTRKI